MTGKTSIVLKYLMKNIAEKKLRSILIVCSIAMASALYFGTIALTTTFEDLFAGLLRGFYGTADLIVTAAPNSPTFFRLEEPALPGVRWEYCVGVNQIQARLAGDDETSLLLYSADLADIQLLNPVVLPEGYDNAGFSGHRILLSQTYAESRGIGTGDSIELDLNGARHRFVVDAILPASGALGNLNDPRMQAALIPADVIWDLWDVWGRYYMYLVRAEEGADLPVLIERLRAELPWLQFQEALPAAGLEGFALPFRIVLVLVLFAAVFIIYTSFQVIVRERLPVVGTFRSVGATRGLTTRFFLAESLVYGFLGGVVGCLLGFGVLYVITALSVPDWLRGGEIRVAFNAFELVSAFFLGLALSVVSALLPVLRAGRLTPKDVILNSVPVRTLNKRRKFVTGSLLLLVGMVVPRIVPDSFNPFAGIAGLILATIGVIELAPFIADLALIALRPIIRLFFGNIGLLCLKNVKDSRVMLDNIALLLLGLSGLLLINTISYSVVRQVTDIFALADYEAMAWIWPMDRTVETALRRIDGVEDVYSVRETNGIGIEGSQETIGMLRGVDPERYFRYWRYEVPDEASSALNGSRTLLVTNLLAERRGWTTGDIVPLQTPRGVRNYRVSGLFRSWDYGGDFALIGDRYFRMDFGGTQFSLLLIKTSGDANAAVARIRERYERMGIWIQTIEEASRESIESNEKLFLLLQGFVGLVLAVSVIGIVNNLILSFIDRKRSFALLRSIGLDAGGLGRLIFIEALVKGFIGGLAGVVAGLFLLAGSKIVTDSTNMNIDISLRPQELVLYVLAGIVITVAASLGPLARARRLSIMEAMRYE